MSALPGAKNGNLDAYAAMIQSLSADQACLLYTSSEGDPLASVNRASVLSALSQAQSQLDELDSELEAAGEDEVDDKVRSAASGRVKALYAGEGDDVAAVMVENGALALLSLDGYMAVDVASGSYAEGDTVEVRTSDGTVYSGTVSRIAEGTATVLLTDDGPAYGCLLYTSAIRAAQSSRTPNWRPWAKL